MSAGLAGVVGVGVTALLGFGLFLLLGARRRPTEREHPGVTEPHG